MLRDPISKTAATGLSSNNVFFNRHVEHPTRWGLLGFVSSHSEAGPSGLTSGRLLPVLE